MKNQISRIFTMVVLLVFIGITPIYAQSASNVARIKIPFEFNIGSTMLPAGTYSIKPLFASSPNLMFIESSDGQFNIRFFTNFTQANKIQDKTKLIFHQYGTQHFLSQIWMDGNSQGSELIVSPTEDVLVNKTSSSPLVNPQ